MPEGHTDTRSGAGTTPASYVLADTAVLAVAAVWGSSYVVMQLVTRAGVSVPSFLALRFAVAALPLLLLILVRRGSFTAIEVRYGLTYGAMLFAILYLETTGVQYTSAANAGFLITLSVILVPVISRVFGRHIQPWSVYALALLALVGCGLLTLGTSGLSVRSGDLIILAAALIRAFQIFSFGQKTTQRPIDIGRVTLIEVALVAVLGVLVAPLLGSPVWSEAVSMGLSTWLLVAYLGIFGTAYAFAAQLFAARWSSSTRVALIMSTEPLFAALFAVVIGGEALTPVQLGGGLLIVIAALVGRVVEARARVPEA